MECFIPLDNDLDKTDINAVRKSHRLRKFVLFDENLRLFILSPKSKEKKLNVESFSIWINDTEILKSSNFDLFDQVENKNNADDTNIMWQLKPHVCSDIVFRSSVVMNNGYSNEIKFLFKYKYDSTSLSHDKHQDNSKINDRKDLLKHKYTLPNFEPIDIWSAEDDYNKMIAKSMNYANNEKSISMAHLFSSANTNNRTGSKLSRNHSNSMTNYTNTTNNQNHLQNDDHDTDDDDDDTDVLKVEYPIYSLLSMRLRNASLKSKDCILSSLDFQVSKTALQLSETFLNNNSRSDLYLLSYSGSFKLKFHEIEYQLVDKSSHIKIDPICPFQVPFYGYEHDSFSFGYKLPLLSAADLPCRVKVTLNYDFITDNLDDNDEKIKILIPIRTSWETDVTLKRTGNRMQLYSQTSSALSIPKVYGVLPKMGVPESSTSIVNSKMNNVKLKFINNNIKVMKGKKFLMRLQIINNSTSSLDLVIYYNNKIQAPTNTPQSLDRQYQLHKKYSNLTEGIILQSNDYKVPIIGPNESYFVDLSFIGIISGYYSSLNGLKVLDLQTNELIEIGSGACIFVK